MSLAKVNMLIDKYQLVLVSDDVHIGLKRNKVVRILLIQMYTLGKVLNFV